MKIAIFKRTGECSFESVSTDELEGCENYVRITEYVDVEFPKLKGREIVEKQLAAIDRTEKELRNKFQSALNNIERERAELMALPNLEAV